MPTGTYAAMDVARGGRLLIGSEAPEGLHKQEEMKKVSRRGLERRGLREVPGASLLVGAVDEESSYADPLGHVSRDLQGVPEQKASEAHSLPLTSTPNRVSSATGTG